MALIKCPTALSHTLFLNRIDPNHVLRKLLPEARRVSYMYHLRPRVHGFQLPTKDDRNVIPRLLYKGIYMY